MRNVGVAGPCGTEQTICPLGQEIREMWQPLTFPLGLQWANIADCDAKCLFCVQYSGTQLHDFAGAASHGNSYSQSHSCTVAKLESERHVYFVLREHVDSFRGEGTLLSFQEFALFLLGSFQIAPSSNAQYLPASDFKVNVGTRCCNWPIRSNKATRSAFFIKEGTENMQRSNTQFYSKCYPHCGKRANIWETTASAEPFLQTLKCATGMRHFCKCKKTPTISRVRIFASRTPFRQLNHLTHCGQSLLLFTTVHIL